MAVTYRYMSSEEWGMRRIESQVRTERRPDPEGTLHHSAGNPMHSMDAVKAFQQMNEQAIAKGYWCIAYDVLVHEQILGNNDRIITIGEGRGPYMSGATKDRNEETEAICALGYFHPGHSLSDRPSAYMVEGIALAFAWGIKNGWIAKEPYIYGHRDNPAHPNATSCPGDYLWSYLPSIRTRVIELTKEGTYMHGFIPRPTTVEPRIFDTRGPASHYDSYKIAAKRARTGQHVQLTPSGA